MLGKELFLAALSLTFVVSASVAKDLKPTSFKAAYSMEIDTDEISTVSACAVAGDVTVIDSRTRPVVGRGRTRIRPTGRTRSRWRTTRSAG